MGKFSQIIKVTSRPLQLSKGEWLYKAVLKFAGSEKILPYTSWKIFFISPESGKVTKRNATNLQICTPTFFYSLLSRFIQYTWWFSINGYNSSLIREHAYRSNILNVSALWDQLASPCSLIPRMRYNFRGYKSLKLYKSKLGKYTKALCS